MIEPVPMDMKHGILTIEEQEILFLFSFFAGHGGAPKLRRRENPLKQSTSVESLWNTAMLKQSLNLQQTAKEKLTFYLRFFFL